MIEQAVFATLLFVFYLLVFSSFFTSQEVAVSEDLQDDESENKATEASKNKYDESVLESMEELIKIIAESEYAKSLIEQKEDVVLEIEVHEENNSEDIAEEVESLTVNKANNILLEIVSEEDQKEVIEAISTLTELSPVNGQNSTEVEGNNLSPQTKLFDLTVTETKDNNFIAQEDKVNLVENIDEPEDDSELEEVDEHLILEIEAREEAENQKLAKERELETQKGVEELFEEISDVTEAVTVSDKESQEFPEAEFSTNHDTETKELETVQEEENQKVEDNENQLTEEVEEIKDDKSVIVEKTSAELIEMYHNMPNATEMVHGIKDENINKLKVAQLRKLAKEINVPRSVKGKQLNKAQLKTEIMLKLKALEMNRQNEIAEFIENLA